MRIRRIKRSGAQLDLIPMIDVVFQLILFFLVSTTFIQLPGISLKLPSSSTADAVETAGITLTVRDDGMIWLDDQSVTIETLATRLATIGEAEIAAGRTIDEYPVRLEADEMVTNGTIVSIFDVLRQNGFLSVHLRTTDDSH